MRWSSSRGYDSRGAAYSWRTGACSTMCPSAHERRRWSASPGDHPQVVVARIEGGAGGLAHVVQDPQDLRLHGDVEGGGRLVGEMGPGRSRWPSRSSPAAACRRTARAGKRGRAAPATGMPTQPQQLHPRGEPQADTSRCAVTASASWSPTGTRESSADNESWKTTSDVAASRRRSPSGAEDLGAAERRCRTPAAGGQQTETARTVTDLPEPDSPTMPRTCPRWTVRWMPSTAGGPSPKETRSPRISCNAAAPPCPSWTVRTTVGAGTRAGRQGVDGVAQAVADKVHREDEHHEQAGREEEHPR